MLNGSDHRTDPIPPLVSSVNKLLLQKFREMALQNKPNRSWNHVTLTLDVKLTCDL